MEGLPIIYTIVILGISLYVFFLLIDFLRLGIKAFKIYINNNEKS